MERAKESNHVLPLGVIARQLQRGFDRLGSRVSVIQLVWSLHGSDLREPLGQSDHALVVEVRPRHVNQFAGLLLNGGDDLGMAVAGRSYGDAGGEIEELVAVNVFDDNAPAALGDHRIRTGVRRRNVTGIAIENSLGIRAG